MNLIVAIDNNLGIGYKGQLLYHLTGDLKYFKNITTGKIVVMGKNTYLSLPKRPLPNRTNIVLTKSGQQFDGAITCTSKEELFKLLNNYNDDDVFIIGGASVYKELLPYCQKAYITKVHASINADTYFEDFDKFANWKLFSVSEMMQENGISYEFLIYKNLQPLPIQSNRSKNLSF